MKLPDSEKAGVCTLCGTGVLSGESHAELKLSVWREPSTPGPATHHGLLMVCHRCSAELGIAGTEPPRITLMRLIRELIVREEFAAAIPEPEPVRLENYEPDTGFTDDGLEISRKPNVSDDKQRKTIH